MVRFQPQLGSSIHQVFSYLLILYIVLIGIRIVVFAPDAEIRISCTKRKGSRGKVTWRQATGDRLGAEAAE